MPTESAPLPWQEAKRIALEICDGLRIIHDAGIIHRDLKSRNIMLASRNGSVRAVVMDFGLARRHSESSPDSEPRSLGISGTPAYMSPEQAHGEPPSPASDVFALGLILYEMVTGKQVITARKVLEALRLIEKLDPAAHPLAQVRPVQFEEWVAA